MSYGVNDYDAFKIWKKQIIKQMENGNFVLPKSVAFNYEEDGDTWSLNRGEIELFNGLCNEFLKNIKAVTSEDNIITKNRHLDLCTCGKSRTLCKIEEYQSTENVGLSGAWIKLYGGQIIEIGKFTRDSSVPIYNCSLKDAYKGLTKEEQLERSKKSMSFLKESFPSLYYICLHKITANQRYTAK